MGMSNQMISVSRRFRGRIVIDSVSFTYIHLLSSLPTPIVLSSKASRLAHAVIGNNPGIVKSGEAPKLRERD